MKIQGAVVFITGANRGLGLAFAQECLRRGARKVYTGMRNPNGSGTPGVEQVGIDLTNPASITAAATKCGDTTILVNNAGIARLTSSTLDPSMIELRKQKTLVLGLHVGFMDTDLTKGYDMKKVDPRAVAEAGLNGIEAGKEEVLVDDFTREVKQSLCKEQSIYLNPPELG